MNPPHLEFEEDAQGGAVACKIPTTMRVLRSTNLIVVAMCAADRFRTPDHYNDPRSRVTKHPAHSHEAGIRQTCMTRAAASSNPCLNVEKLCSQNYARSDNVFWTSRETRKLMDIVLRSRTPSGTRTQILEDPKNLFRRPIASSNGSSRRRPTVRS